jgi:hypothetical protein
LDITGSGDALSSAHAEQWGGSFKAAYLIYGYDQIGRSSVLMQSPEFRPLVSIDKHLTRMEDAGNIREKNL